MAKNLMVSISELQVHKELQAPDRSNPSHVDDLAEAVKNGAKLPRPKIMAVEGYKGYLTIDGHHTIEAHEKAGKKQVACAVYPGKTLEDAKLLYASTNKEHLGLKRSRATKEHQVRMYLEVKPDHAVNTVAKAVGVSHDFVKAVIKAMNVKVESPAVRVGSDGVAGRTGRPRKADAPPAAKPLFNWKRVDEAFGIVSRAVDEVAGLLEDKDRCKKGNAALKGLWKILDLWKAKLEKKQAEAQQEK